MTIILDQEQVAADIRVVREHVMRFLRAATAEDWERRTEGNEGWTLAETVCHLEGAAFGLRLFAKQGLRGEREGRLPGFTDRRELGVWNEKVIEKRIGAPIEEVVAGLEQILLKVEQEVLQVPVDKCNHWVDLPIYGTGLTVLELFAAQAVHAGLVHAAQLANGRGKPFLWRAYPMDVQMRLLGYLFILLGAVYWPERGPAGRTVVGFRVRRPWRRDWHLVLTESGGEAFEGEGEADVQIVAWDVDSLAQLFTLQMGVGRAVLTGRAWAWGDVGLAFNLTEMFRPA
ncbi:MAG TPA: maleylpyruvate isomerase N-terminal domain-containing protein [Anaerolineae bacterium]|nr:maleylpyruvate isomerase N-terminal domain-containing protein [Anaerolineae bacterium]